MFAAAVGKTTLEQNPGIDWRTFRKAIFDAFFYYLFPLQCSGDSRFVGLYDDEL